MFDFEGFIGGKGAQYFFTMQSKFFYRSFVGLFVREIVLRSRRQVG